LALLVGPVVALEVVVDTNWGKGIAESVNDKDGCNQKRKDFVCKAGCVEDYSVETDKGRDDPLDRDPKTNPRVEGEKWHFQTLGHLEEDFCKDKDWTCTAVNHLRSWRENSNKLRPW